MPTQRSWLVSRVVSLMAVVLLGASAASAQDLPSIEEVRAALDARVAGVQSLHVRLGKVRYRNSQLLRRTQEPVLSANSVVSLDLVRRGDTLQCQEASVGGAGSIERALPVFRFYAENAEEGQLAEFGGVPRIAMDEQPPGALAQVKCWTTRGKPRHYGGWVQFDIGLANGLGEALSSRWSDDARVVGFETLAGHRCVRVDDGPPPLDPAAIERAVRNEETTQIEGPRSWYLAVDLGCAPIRLLQQQFQPVLVNDKYAPERCRFEQIVDTWLDHERIAGLWLARRCHHRQIVAERTATGVPGPPCVWDGQISSAMVIEVNTPGRDPGLQVPLLVGGDFDDRDERSRVGYSINGLFHAVMAGNWPFGFTREELLATDV